MKQKVNNIFNALKNISYFKAALCLLLISVGIILVRILPLPMPIILKMLLILPLLSIFVFLFFISVEDAETKMITRRKNIAFIISGIIFYTIRVLYMKTSFANIQSETISLVGVFLVFMFLGKIRKWGIGDSLMCTGLIMHYLTLFGHLYIFITLITIITACVIYILYNIIQRIVKKETFNAFAPYIYISSVLVILFTI